MAPAATSWKTQVGDAERRVIGVELGTGPIEVAEDDHTQPAQGARGEEGAGHDETGTCQRAAVTAVAVPRRPPVALPSRVPRPDSVATALGWAAR